METKARKYKTSGHAHGRAGTLGAAFVHKSCVQCGKDVARYASQFREGTPVFCNRTCRSLFLSIEVKCAKCGVKFRKQKARMVDHEGEAFEKHFCSRECWAGRAKVTKAKKKVAK